MVKLDHPKTGRKHGQDQTLAGKEPSFLCFIIYRSHQCFRAAWRMTGMSSIRRITQSGHPLGSVLSTVLRGSYSGRRPPCIRYLALPFPARTHSFQSSLVPTERTWNADGPRNLSGLPRPQLLLSAHRFHSSTRILQEQRKGEEVKDPPRQPSEDGPQDKQNTSGGQNGRQGSSRSSSSGEGDQGDQKSKEDSPPPPPPPHGDKTPWQVFTETLRSEFQASKEWNESTKALASSANQFTESESVRRARAAYTAAQDAATSTTASALRSTGKALGKGAAWTWDTPVVKGVRAGVNATGKAIEKGTRPVRETEAYKKAVGEVKDVIDDGTSSRYGGWTEKEERRRRRELRELNEAKASRRPGRQLERMEEDPKYVVDLPTFTGPSSINMSPALVPTSPYTKMQHGRRPGAISRTPIG